MKKKNPVVEAGLCREQEHMAAFHSSAFKHLYVQMRSGEGMEYPVQKPVFLNLPCVALQPVCAELALHKHTVIDYIWHAP